MKAKELMLDDWVLYEGEPYQIRQLGIHGVNRDGEDYPAVCIGKPKGIGLIVERNEIEPIPLTKEILEKIGFKEQVLDVMQLDEYKDGKLIYYIYWKYIDKKEGSYLKIASFAYETGDFSRFLIKYVHELQHALRLCGIDKMIEL